MVKGTATAMYTPHMIHLMRRRNWRSAPIQVEEQNRIAKIPEHREREHELVGKLQTDENAGGALEIGWSGEGEEPRQTTHPAHGNLLFIREQHERSKGECR